MVANDTFETGTGVKENAKIVFLIIVFSRRSSKNGRFRSSFSIFFIRNKGNVIAQIPRYGSSRGVKLPSTPAHLHSKPFLGCNSSSVDCVTCLNGQVPSIDPFPP